MGSFADNNLGLGAKVWLVLAFLSCLTIFFKFTRLWSIRNLDLLLLFVFAPGMLVLVGRPDAPPWVGFAWLFVSSFVWLVRCMVDLGLTRRPLLEPNLNASGLACLSTGLVLLLVAESVSLPLLEGATRNPADAGERVHEVPSPSTASDGGDSALTLPVAESPGILKWASMQIILSRLLAGVSHLGVVACLLVIGWKIFDRPISGLACTTCYLLLPYTRIEVVDSGQVFPMALILTAIAVHQKPALAGALIGIAAGTMPAAIGLIPIWAGFYRGRGTIWFLSTGVAVIAVCASIGLSSANVALWARRLGARSLAEAGLLPSLESTRYESVWSGVDPSYRLPILVAYMALVVMGAFWPSEKNMAHLISLSAAVLIASQFWYMDRGGTHVLLFLPLLLLMIFRPNLSNRRAPETAGLRRRPVEFSAPPLA